MRLPPPQTGSAVHTDFKQERIAIMIKIDHLIKRYGANYAVDDVSFEIKKGEVVGIVGNNGAGKSTLLKVISGILRPTKGTVELGGNVVPMLELGSGFDYDLTGRENIFLSGMLLGFSKEQKKSFKVSWVPYGYFANSSNTILYIL